MTNTLMTPSLLRSARSAALMAAIALACGASFAEKPDGGHGGGHGGQKGHGGGDKHGYKEHKDKGHYQNQRVEHGPVARTVVRKDDRRSYVSNVRVGNYFHDEQRVVINNYYGEQFRRGYCPPGLAKKNNGCMPPGQAKKYTVGQRLPSNVTYYAVPQTVSTQLGAPPSGYKYVRVATDVLLLAVGTGMVVDALQNLGGL